MPPLNAASSVLFAAWYRLHLQDGAAGQPGFSLVQVQHADVCAHLGCSQRLSIIQSTRSVTYLPPFADLAFQRNACPLNMYSFFMKAQVLHTPSGPSFCTQLPVQWPGRHCIEPLRHLDQSGCLSEPMQIWVIACCWSEVLAGQNELLQH